MTAEEFLELEHWERISVAGEHGIRVPADPNALTLTHWGIIAEAIERATEHGDDGGPAPELPDVDDDEDEDAYWFTEGEFD